MTTMTTVKAVGAQDLCAVADILARHAHLPTVSYLSVGVYSSDGRAHAAGSVQSVEDVEAWAEALSVSVVHHGVSWWTGHVVVDTAAGDIEWNVSYTDPEPPADPAREDRP